MQNLSETSTTLVMMNGFPKASCKLALMKYLRPFKQGQLIFRGPGYI